MDLTQLPLPADVLYQISTHANTDAERIHFAVTLPNGKRSYDEIRETDDYWRKKILEEFKVTISDTISNPAVLERFYFILALVESRSTIPFKLYVSYLPDIFQLIQLDITTKKLQSDLCQLYLLIAIVCAPNVLEVFTEWLAKEDGIFISAFIRTITSRTFLFSVTSQMNKYDNLKTFFNIVKKHCGDEFYLIFRNHHSILGFHYTDPKSISSFISTIEKSLPNTRVMIELESKDLNHFTGDSVFLSLYGMKSFDSTIQVLDAIVNAANFRYLQHSRIKISDKPLLLETFLLLLSSYGFLKWNCPETNYFSEVTEARINDTLREEFKVYYQKTEYREKLERFVREVANQENKPFFLTLLEK